MELVRIDLDLLDEDTRNRLETRRHELAEPWSIFLLEVLETYSHLLELQEFTLKEVE